MNGIFDVILSYTDLTVPFAKILTIKYKFILL